MPDVFIEQDDSAGDKEPALPPTLASVSLMQRPAGTPGLFTAFCAKPRGLTFENQEPDEVIVLLLRRHFVTNLPWLFFALIFAVLPVIFFLFLGSEIFAPVVAFLPHAYLIILTAFYYLILIGFVLTQFATWYYQVGIITDFRVIDVDFNSLLSRNIAYTEIEDVVDVEAIQGGLLQNFFNFGTVQVQTEGLKPNFEFVNIPHPTLVADTLSDLMRGRRRHA